MNLNRRDLFRRPLSTARGALEPALRPPRPAPGAEPGMLRSGPGAARPTVTVLAYRPLELAETVVDDVALLRQMRGKWPVVWVHVDGVAHAPTLRAVGDVFGLHPLALEDLGDVQQRGTVKAYDGHLFASLRLPRLAPGLDLEQVAVFLGPDFVVTVQERPGGVLDPLRARIRASQGRLRASGPDFLASAVLDTVIDHYFPVTEAYAERLRAVEAEIAGGPSRAAMARLHAVKRDLSALRRAVVPVRDALSTLVGEPGPLIRPETVVYVRDTADHARQIADVVQMQRESASSLTDVFRAAAAARTTGILRVLTVLVAILLPLAVFAGILAMDGTGTRGAWAWALPFVGGMMTATAVLGMIHLARKGWLGRDG